MPYTAATPPLPETPDQLRARIPGWGADLDPAVRPSQPKLLPPDLTRYGAHWEVPERQEEHAPRERSVEHAHLTPVFGTAQPTRGLAGTVRRHAYRRYSEARTAHWLLLVAADRLDVLEHRLAAPGTRRALAGAAVAGAAVALVRTLARPGRAGAATLPAPARGTRLLRDCCHR